MNIVLALFLVTLAAVLGGGIAKLFKLPSLVGYILFGIVFSIILPESIKSVHNLAEIGTILLLFSIGVELSLDSLTRFLKISILGAIIQMVLVALIYGDLFGML